MRPFLILALLCGCPANHGARPGPSVDARIAIARLEARRGAGVDELIGRAQRGDAAERDLAVRALGRVGGPRALDALIAALRDPSPAIASRAASAIGVLAATSDPSPAVMAKTSAALITALDVPAIDVAAVVEALGRAGDATAAVPALVARLAAKDPAVAAAAANSLLRFGRREVALDDTTHAALIGATTAATAEVRHAAVIALAREFRGKPPAPADARVVAALTAAIGDTDAETRAVAIDGVRRHQAVGDAASRIEQALQDPDWRVAVEAVRALGGADGTDAGRDAVAVVLVRTWAVLAAGTAPARAHVLLEGLRTVGASAARPAVRNALTTLASSAEGATPAKVPVLVRGWVHCLATADLERADPVQFDAGARVLACGGGAVAPHLRAELLAELIEAEVGTPTQRMTAITTVLAAEDARSRAAMLGAIAGAWPKLDARDRDQLVPTVATALTTRTDGVEVGTAAETVRGLLEITDLPADAKAALTAALIDRATRETDPEIESGLLDTLAQAKLPEGKPACDHGAAAVSPVIRAAAGRCLAALAGTPADDRPLDEPAAAEPPADDVAAVIGKTVTWTITTARGTITIALAPDVAPWHVAAIAALTRRGFYDGLVFHRVVPDFVVQGGDPTGTGWGGPGFTLPAEPGTSLDGDSYATGAIGIADAGKDSGGSQWFAMHSHAPYLEGRYTRIGQVTDGQGIVDSLVVGDAIVKATIEIR